MLDAKGTRMLSAGSEARDGGDAIHGSHIPWKSSLERISGNLAEPWKDEAGGLQPWKDELGLAHNLFHIIVVFC